MRPVVRAWLVLAGLSLPAVASGNGRLPGPTNLRLHPNQEGRFLLGATFGLVESSDGGTTTSWVCENAVGYGGEYDPDYAFHPTRDEIWSTTFEGLRVTRDGGCTWENVGEPFAEGTFVSEVEIGPDGRVWAATSNGDAANDIFVSTDGVAFVSAGLLDETGWWESIKVAPGNADILYVTGYRAANEKMAIEEDGYIRKSINGGDTWTEVPETGITFGPDPRMMILGVSPTNPNIVFLRVLNAGDPLGDAIYRSDDGGTTWDLVLELAHAMRGFAIAPDGMSVYAGTAKLCADDDPLLPDAAIRQKGCLFKSTSAGAMGSWEKAGYSPRLGPDNTPATSNGLAIDADGTLYAGGQNGVDGWIVGKSTDGAETFTKVLGLTDIDGPLECPDETAQGTCADLSWPSICQLNFICPAADDAAPIGGDAGDATPSEKGCCAVAPTPAQLAWNALLALAVGLVLLRRRRR